MSVSSWTLRIELPEPDGGAALHLTVAVETQSKPAGITRGRSQLWVRYPTEAEAREAMGVALAARPQVHCSVAAIPSLAARSIDPARSVMATQAARAAVRMAVFPPGGVGGSAVGRNE